MLQEQQTPGACSLDLLPCPPHKESDFQISSQDLFFPRIRNLLSSWRKRVGFTGPQPPCNHSQQGEYRICAFPGRRVKNGHVSVYD